MTCALGTLWLSWQYVIYYTVYTIGTPCVEGKIMQVAKLFMNGRSQAVRLPAEFRFDGDEVFIRRDPLTGDVILSRRDGWTSWDEFLAGRDLSAVPADFLEDRAQPVLEQRTTLDDVVSAERAATQFPKPKVQR